MKKIILSAIIIAVFSLATFSQTTVKVAFGINNSRLNTDAGDWSNQARIGYQMGGSWLFGDKLYVEPGIYWATMSSDMVHKDEVDFNFENKIGMIRIPVFAGYHILGDASESFFNLRAFGGPSVAFITSVEESTGITKSDFNSVLWGINAGVGINVWWLFLDMGYEWGLNDVYSKAELGSSKSTAFWANLGVRFRM